MEELLDPDWTDDGFPFQETASGNLKIHRNQVSLQSQNVAILLANPDHVTLKNIKETHKPAAPAKSMMNCSTQFDSSAPLPRPRQNYGQPPPSQGYEPPRPIDPSPQVQSQCEDELPPLRM